MRRPGRLLRPLLPLLFAAACTGSIAEDGERPGEADPAQGAPAPAPGPAGGTPGTMPPTAGTPAAAPGTPPGAAPDPVIPPATDGLPAPGGPAVRPLRRLTRFELDNTVRDLLGDTSRPGSALPPDSDGPHGFEVGPAVSPLDALVLQEVAEKLAATAVRANLARLVPCKLPGDDACGRQFVATFGRRAFRRPLLPDEQAALEGLYTNARAQLGYDFAQSVRVVISAVLQSPEFLYHWELGARAPAVVVAGKLVQLTPHEVAARVAYLITGSMPDDELLAAADAGAVATPDGIAAHARRLLAGARAREGLGRFFVEWWDLDRIRRTDKGANVAGWDGLREPMRLETQRLIEAVLLEGDATMKTLLSAPYTYLNSASLARAYGAALPVAPASPTPATTFQKVDLDPAQRAGFLTQGSFLAAQAAPTETSPVKRGHLVLTQLLCTKLPDPPGDVPPLPPSSGALKTMRQRAEEHMSNPACSSCHRLIDPLGFAFETYDTIGRWRTTDRGEPVDAAGAVSLGGQARTFKNGVELAGILGASAEVHGCAARQILRYAFTRPEVADDEPVLKEIGAAANLRDVILALVRSKAFSQRAPAAGEILP